MLVLVLSLTLHAGAADALPCGAFAPRMLEGASIDALLQAQTWRGRPLTLKHPMQKLAEGVALSSIGYCDAEVVVSVKDGTIVGSAWGRGVGTTGVRVLSFDCKRDGKPAPNVFGSFVALSGKLGEVGVVNDQLGIELLFPEDEGYAGIACVMPKDVAPRVEFRVVKAQRPPLVAPAGAECPIANARPALVGGDYQKQSYALTQVKASPLTLRESLTWEDGTRLSIEQTGCSDIDQRFTFDFRKKGLSSRDKLVAARRVLGALHFQEGSLFDAGHAKQVGLVIDAYLAQTKRLADFVLCTALVGSECITDISVSFSRNGLTLRRIDRP